MGYLRFGRRIKIGPGLHLNLSRSGVSLSMGPRGAKFTIGPRGHRVSLGIPGTGLSYIITGGGKKKRPPAERASKAAPRAAPRSAPPPPPAPVDDMPVEPQAQGEGLPQVPEPGFFASAAEKRFAQGVRALVEGDPDRAAERFLQSVEADAQDKRFADDFMAGVALLLAGKPDEAVPFLEYVVSSDAELPDELMNRYIGELRAPVEISPHVVVEAPMSSLGAALLLAEAYQLTGDLHGAAGTMETLVEHAPDVPLFQLALAELYYLLGHDEGVLDVTNGLTPDDEIGFAAQTYRALALLAQGRADAALEVTRGLLGGRRKLQGELVQDALYARAMSYDAKGQTERARQDFEKLYALNSAYPGLREWLGTYQSSEGE